MKAFFCDQTGVRIAAPGVSKAVDPEGGQLELVEDEVGNLVEVDPTDPKPEKGSKKSKQEPVASPAKEEQPAPPAGGGTDPKPEKGSK